MTSEATFRSLVLLNVAICLPIGLYHRIKSQATSEKLDRKEEGLFLMVALRVCGVTAWVVVAAYLIDPFWVSWSSVRLPPWLRWTGAVVGLLIVPPLLFWTMQSLGKNLTDTVVTRRHHHLVTHGPYRWVRHPFYCFVGLWGLAISLEMANWLVALLGLAALAMLVKRTRVEEGKLVERFGDEYRAYAAKTGRFFPRLGHGGRVSTGT